MNAQRGVSNPFLGCLRENLPAIIGAAAVGAIIGEISGAVTILPRPCCLVAWEVSRSTL